MSCEPSSPTARARVKDNVDHTQKAQHGSGACRPAILGTPRTIDIGVDKTNADFICTDGADCTNDNFDL